MATTTPEPPHILIVGGGYVGLYTAFRLQRKLKPGEATITVVDPNSYMTYQPFLPEAAAGNLEPRHVVVPLRRVLDQVPSAVTARITRSTTPTGMATFQPLEGDPSRADLRHPRHGARLHRPHAADPGAREQGIGFKSVAEAIFLRNHVLTRLDIAAQHRSTPRCASGR